MGSLEDVLRQGLLGLFQQQFNLFRANLKRKGTVKR
jgi:hypothetical protein